MPVSSEHPEYTKYKYKWQVVNDAESSCYEQYIIPPCYTGRGTSQRVSQRNLNYVARAVYSNFVYGTLSVLVGTATYKEPLINLPPALEYLKDDCTEDRLAMPQLTRKALRHVAANGRFAMLTDYPALEAGLTAEALASINPVPRIRYYAAEDVINWDTKDTARGRVLSFVVVRELVRVRLDGYKWGQEYQYRVVELDENGYYRFMIRNKIGEDLLTDWAYPRYNGQLINYIPMDIVGAEDNNINVDEPPMYPIAHLNFGHLRNSASYEDNLDAHASGTLFVASTLNDSQWKAMTSVKPMMMGSREAHYIGQPGSQATLCQLEAGQEIVNAMNHKEKQMLAMGAFMFTDPASNQAVGTTQMYMGAKNSPIVNYVRNYQQALKNQIINCARFLGISEDSIEVLFPVDFVPKNADPQVMQQMLAQQLAGILPKRVLRDYNRDVDLIPDHITNEQIQAEIDAEGPISTALTPQAAAATTNPNGTQ